MKKFNTLYQTILVEQYVWNGKDDEVIYLMTYYNDGNSSAVCSMNKYTPYDDQDVWSDYDLDSTLLKCDSMQHAIDQFLHTIEGRLYNNHLTPKLVQHVNDQLKPFENVVGTWFGGRQRFAGYPIMGIKVNVQYYKQQSIKQLHANNPLNNLIDL